MTVTEFLVKLGTDVAARAEYDADRDGYVDRSALSSEDKEKMRKSWPTAEQINDAVVESAGTAGRSRAAFIDRDAGNVK